MYNQLQQTKTARRITTEAAFDILRYVSLGL